MTRSSEGGLLTRRQVAGFCLWAATWTHGVACAKAPAAQDAGGRPNTGARMNASQDAMHCIGRFQFSTPAGFIVAGRSQSIYRVKVAAIARPAGGLDEILAGRLAALARGKPSVVRSFELEPAVRGTWYVADPRKPGLRELLAIKDLGDHALVATRGGEAAKSDAVESLVKTVVRAYVPGKRAGFCIGAGAITSEPGANEETLIVLTHPDAPALEIEFATRTVREPDTTTYSDLDEERNVAAAHGGTLAVLRDQMRRAAGRDGKEIWMQSSIPDQAPLLRFTWHFPGMAGSSSHPMINIKGIAPASQRAALEKSWEAVLGSLQALPPA